MSHPLNTKSKRIYDRLLQHPVSHNLEWRDVQTLFEALGGVEKEHNGNLKLMVGENALVVQAPRMSENVTEDQIMQLRHLLRHNKKRDVTGGPHLLIVIDHLQARIFEMEKEGAEPINVVPYSKDGHGRKLHGPQDHFEHRESRDMSDFYESIAGRILGSGEIVVFGSGQGESSAMDGFMNWLESNRPKLYEHVIGTYSVDQTHMTEPELLAKAREIYAM